MPRLRVLQQADSIDTLELRVEPQAIPTPAAGEVVVEARFAGVNQSDVKATLGAMAHAVWPRTPGRDWSGIVCAGPSALIGQAVFGSGGDLGITRDGSHARYLLLPRNAIVPVPNGMTLPEAGAVGVPFVTAQDGFRRARLPRPGDIVLVMGANGNVGEAAVQIASAYGAKVFAVTRRHAAYAGHSNGPVQTIDASEDVAAVVRTATAGHGADIVFNAVGSPYFAAANAAMALEGRQILISTIDRAVPFDIRQFYRGRHIYVGVDSLALDASASAAILLDLAPMFAAGQLQAFPVEEATAYPLEQAKNAFRSVLQGTQERVVLRI